MESRSLQIVNAFACGASACKEDTCNQIIRDKYADFKVDLIKKSEHHQQIMFALSYLEYTPSSVDLQKILIHTLENLDAVLLEELDAKAQTFLALLKAEGYRIIYLDNTYEKIETNGGAVVKGKVDVVGDFINGNKITNNRYIGPSTDDPVEALKIYLGFIANKCSTLPIRAIDISVNDPTNKPRQIGLSNIYIDLNTTTNESPTEKNSTPLSVLDAIIHNQRLVLLGDPGSGKSTFLAYLTLCLAMHNLYPESNWLKKLPNWPQSKVNSVPIIVTLRDFSRSPKPDSPNQPNHLWNFIVQQLEQQNLRFASKALCEKLETGGVILLLDGLDEVSRQDARMWVCTAVQSFIDRYPECTVIVTCRILSYQNPSWKLEGLSTFTIDKFSDTKIDSFIRAWYHTLQELRVVRDNDTSRLIASLQRAVKQPGLRQLASNPLLLAVMAQLHAFKGRLPDARTLLYKEAVDLLLYRWNEVTHNEKTLSEHLAEVKRNIIDLERLLWRVAYTTHERNTQFQLNSDQVANSTATYSADISETELLNEFVKWHQYSDRSWAVELVELIKLRAGLLVERSPGIYAFVHRTFQEYLAGAYLATDLSQKIADEVLRLSKDIASWREVILLAIGRLFYVLGDVATPLLIVAELCPVSKPQNEQEWSQAWLAGEIIEKLGAHRAKELKLGQELHYRVSNRLVDLLNQKLFTPVERASIARTLANIGDPRPGVGLQKNMPDFSWCKVPTGRFQMGGDRLVARGYWEAKEFDIPYTYQITKYPVTYAQFEPFVKAGGYHKKQYWSSAGWAWLQQKDTKQKDEKAKEPISQPKYWDDPDYHISNHPVVGLSWYECFAYTQWLSEQLGYVVRLPTEAEWEKAARYPDNRYFPWGNELLSGAANVYETYERLRFDNHEIDKNIQIGTHHIDRTTAVGLYVNYASELGLHDLSGNIWEWLLSPQTSLFNAQYNHYLPEEIGIEGEGRRQMRGGSWQTDISRARLSYRASNPPISQDPTDGFRLVYDSRFPLDEWRLLQKASISIVDPIPPHRERGTVLKFENGQGTLCQSNNNSLSFDCSDVKGASAFQSLDKGDIVTFELDNTNPSCARNVKRLFSGIVREWNRTSAFGFITLGNNGYEKLDIYMHHNDILKREDWELMKPSGDRVEFEIDDALLSGEEIPEAKNICIIDN